MTTDVGGGNLTGCTIAGTDVRNLVFMLEYYESIYSSAATCNITLNDAAGFFQNAQLKGGEDVSIAFGSRAGESIRMNFKVGKVGDRVRAMLQVSSPRDVRVFLEELADAGAPPL